MSNKSEDVFVAGGIKTWVARTGPTTARICWDGLVVSKVTCLVGGPKPRNAVPRRWGSGSVEIEVDREEAPLTWTLSTAEEIAVPGLPPVPRLRVSHSVLLPAHVPASPFEAEPTVERLLGGELRLSWDVPEGYAPEAGTTYVLVAFLRGKYGAWDLKFLGGGFFVDIPAPSAASATWSVQGRAIHCKYRELAAGALDADVDQAWRVCEYKFAASATS